jgi:NSS family neurotransmitter:Na+ symporter
MSKVQFLGKTFFDWLDYIASNILLPIGGLLIVAFIGWYLDREKTRAEVTNAGQLKAGYLPLYLFLAKFVAPVIIAIVFLHGLGLF